MDMDTKQKKHTLHILASIFVCMLMVALAGCGKTESYRQIKLYEIEGDVTVSREKSGNVEPYVNMMLQDKDNVETAAESYVQLQLDGDKYVLVEPSSKITLEATGDSVDSKTKINLTQGAVVNKIEKPLSKDSTYEVTTPNSTMAVRGTTFRVEVKFDENGESYTTLSVCEGKVQCQLITPDGTIVDEIVELQAGEQAKIRGTSEISEYLGGKQTFDYEEFKEKVVWFIGYVEEVIETEPEDILEDELATDTEDEPEEPEEEPVTDEEPEEEGTPADNEDEPAEPQANEEESSEEEASSEETPSQEPAPTPTPAPSNPTSYTVTFKDSAGNVFATQKVTSGKTATQPILKPAGSGSWNFDFSTAITANTEIVWTPN